MNNTNPKVDFYFNKPKKWLAELTALRTLALDCGLFEELKWGHPCYTSEKRNIVLLHGFKDYCAIMFIKGALLKDPQAILIQQTEAMQSARQIRFTSTSQITEMEPLIKACISEAIDNEKAGLKVIFKENKEIPVPEELQKKLDEIPALKAAFAALTPGRQRAYNFYFSAPKQSKTRYSRVEKCMPQILNGKGLNDE